MTKMEFSTDASGAEIETKSYFNLKRIKQCECLAHLNVWTTTQTLLSATPTNGIGMCEEGKN